MIGWAAGLIAGVLLLGIAVVGSSLWSMNEKVAVQSAQLISLQSQQTTMQAQLTECLPTKYNNSDATKDRASMLELFAKQLERSYAQDAKLQVLAEFKARMEERLKIQEKP